MKENIKTVEQIISDAKIESVWGNSNFGTTPKREVIKEALMKKVLGYHSGHTATCIITELGLITSPKGSALTDLGLQYLIASVQEPDPHPLPVQEQGGKTFRWVRSHDRKPDVPGTYHTNLGLTDWGNSGNDGDTELYWLNRHGGHVREWLEEYTSPASQPSYVGGDKEDKPVPEPIKYRNLPDQQQWQEMGLDEKESYLTPEWRKWNEEKTRLRGNPETLKSAFDYATSFGASDKYGHIRQESFIAGANWSALTMYRHMQEELSSIKAERDEYRKALDRISEGLPAEGRSQTRSALSLDHQETATIILNKYPKTKD